MANQFDELDKLVEEGKFSVAEPRLLDWLQYHPSDSRAWLLYGKCVSNPAQKRNCFKRALDLDPSNSEALELLEQLGTATLHPPAAGEKAGVNTPSLPISSPLPTKSSSISTLSESPVINKQPKTGLSVILYSLFHFLFTVFLGILLIVIFSASVPGLLSINKPDEKIQRNWLSNANPAEADQELQNLAGIFLNPSRLDYREVSSYQELRNHRTSITIDSSEMKTVEFNGVSFMGQLVGGNVLQRGTEGQPLVVIMNIVFDETRIPVVYYGLPDDFDYEDMVLIEGVYIEEANGIMAQRIEKISAKASTQAETDALIMLRAAGGILLWGLFCFSVFFWRVNLKKWRLEYAVSPSPVGVLLLLLTISLLTSGCTVELATTLRPDGTGITSILVHETRDNMEFLRSAPGVPGYLSALVRDVRNSGALFEQYIENDQEVFLVQRYFNNSSSDTGDSYPIEGSWVNVQSYREEDENVMRFMSVVDTRTLFNSPGQTDPNVASALRDQLNQVDMKYHLHFPGRLVYHNGDVANDYEIVWQIRMNDVNYLVAEVRSPVENEATSVFDRRYIWIGLSVIWVVSTLFLVASIWIKPVPGKIGRKS